MLADFQLPVIAIVAVAVSAEYKGKIDAGKMKPLAFCNGEYWSLGKVLGKMGFSKKI